MWRCELPDRHFIASTRDDLLRCISECYRAVIPEIKETPPRPIADLMYDQLTTGTLELQQNARRTLIALANGGNEKAKDIVGRLPKKALSFQAKYYAKHVGKEFHELTFQDLSEHVTDIVLREKLVAELANQFKLEDKTC